jgi:hypothetical protein
MRNGKSVTPAMGAKNTPIKEPPSTVDCNSNPMNTYVFISEFRVSFTKHFTKHPKKKAGVPLPSAIVRLFLFLHIVLLQEPFYPTTCTAQGLPLTSIEGVTFGTYFHFNLILSGPSLKSLSTGTGHNALRILWMYISFHVLIHLTNFTG